MTVIGYFKDLGFFSEEAELGKRKKKALLVIGVYITLALGIFTRQISAFPTVDLRIENLRGSVLIASVILALAIAPPLMRWISRRHKGQPNWEHVAWSFTYGFFSNLLMDKIIVEVLKISA